MNAGDRNEAVPCLRAIIATFFEGLRAHRPSLRCELVNVSPRNTSTEIPLDCDLYISTGGPGSPLAARALPWAQRYSTLLDYVYVADQSGRRAQFLLAICFSFELVVDHFSVAVLRPRRERRCGVMPVFRTVAGAQHPLLAALGETPWCFELRDWDALEPDETRLAEVGGQVLAWEADFDRSRGNGLLALSIGTTIESVQFHPEAEPTAVRRWLERPENRSAILGQYGQDAHPAMLRAVESPGGLGRTFETVVPGWLRRSFNSVMQSRERAILQHR